MRWCCRSEEHTSELQSHLNLVCRLLLEKQKNSALMAELVAQFFHATEFTVLQGSPETGAAFAALPFDHLIYTGGTKIFFVIMGAPPRSLLFPYTTLFR